MTVIAPGKARINPVRLLSSPIMQDKMHDFHEQFDLVVVDGPPVLAGGDCWLLSQEVDYTVMLVRAGLTPREDVAAAINEIHGGGRVGMALNMVGKVR
jgi:Mrp family chromosome partitioning ATPase